MQHRRDLYLAVLPEGGHAYAVVTGGDLSRAARFGSRDAAVMHLLRPSDAEPLSGRWIDLGAPGVIAERIVGGPAAAPRARATDRATSHDAALTVRRDRRARGFCPSSARTSRTGSHSWQPRTRMRAMRAPWAGGGRRSRPSGRAWRN